MGSPRARAGSSPRSRLRRSSRLGVALLAAGAVATSTAGAATLRAALLPPKPGGLSVSGGGGHDGGSSSSGGSRVGGLLPPSPTFSVSGGGEGDDGGENGSEGAASATLPPPAAWVSRLQTKLARLGYFSGPFTGVYGPLTTAAVKRFQAASGLAVDGRWGPASQAMLTRRLAARG